MMSKKWYDTQMMIDAVGNASNCGELISKYKTHLNSMKKPQSPYELFQLKNGTWKWRKRAKNKKILNHSYNSKAAAIKGMKADFNVTKEMAEFVYVEVKS